MKRSKNLKWDAGCLIVPMKLASHEGVKQQTPMRMGGVVGEMEFTGLDAEFLPVLALGELLHVGTGTMIGLGKFEATLSHQPRWFEVRRGRAS